MQQNTDLQPAWIEIITSTYSTCNLTSIVMSGREDSSRRKERSEVKVLGLRAGKKGLLNVKFDVNPSNGDTIAEKLHIPIYILYVSKIVSFEVCED